MSFLTSRIAAVTVSSSVVIKSVSNVWLSDETRAKYSTEWIKCIIQFYFIDQTEPEL